MSFARLETLHRRRRRWRAPWPPSRSPRSAPGAWAIIGQQLAIAAVDDVLIWRASRRGGRSCASRARALRDLGGFCGFLVGHRLLFYLHQNADHLLIGRFVGPAALGAYAIAYNVMLAAGRRIAGPVSGSSRPPSRACRTSRSGSPAPGRGRRACVGADRDPVAGRASSWWRPDFVPVVLGDQWAGRGPGDPDAGVGRDAAGAAGSQRRHPDGARPDADALPLLDRLLAAHILAFVIGLHWGIVGVAAAYAISSTLVEPILTVLTARALGVSVGVFVRSLFGVAQAAAAMTVIVVAARLALVDAGAPAAARLGLLTLVGAIAFVPLVMWRAPEVRRDLRVLLGDRRIRLPTRAPAAAPAES